MRNRMISCSSLCGFLLITAALTSTLFLPSKTTLAARELADYYPSDDDKEQSKGLVTGSHSTNSGSATGDSSASSTFQDPPPTSRIINNLNGPPSFSPSNFENDSTTAATTTMPSSGGGGYSGQRPQGYQYESYRSSSSSYQSNSSNSVFRNAETTQASSTRTVTYGSGGVTRVTVVCNSNNEAPRGCEEEEEGANSYP
ncbi:unnamed protein product [Linum tenue]|uniref:Uncharacterized protein n=1 Tax=Linum tenue TaxID=586396 RepID=A0AAV0R5U1_9ROSI|nr:unnamed protein product [Linum tenue]